MEKYNGEEYWDKLSDMSKVQVMQECVKMKKKLCKLSEICDVDDVRDALNENTELTIRLKQKEYQIERSKEIIIAELRELGRKPATGATLQSLTKMLVKTLKGE